ncbi:heavy metal translocating P-type ATPase [Myxococcota bacterium]|nr:heavy metal translocating P-type ATPase [Myxococcota bacterium]
MIDVTIRCAHCGLAMGRAEKAPEAPQFCCSGCRSVHALLHEWGMEDYYRLQDVAPGERAPAKTSGRSFEDFDAPSFAAAHVETTPRGTCATSLYLEGVHCAACVWLVERLPSVTDGIVSIRLDLARARADVEWAPEKTKLSHIGRALDRIGYAPHVYRAKDVARLREQEHRRLLVQLGVAAASAGNIMLVQAALYAGEAQGMDPGFVSFFRWITLFLALPVIFYSARPFYRSAWAGIIERIPHVDLPLSIAIVAAAAHGIWSIVKGSGPIYFDSIAALVALLLGARYLQARAQRAALERAESVRGAALVEFARRVEPSGETKEVPVEELAKGDVVEVRAGELVPADGVVTIGRSSLDNAVLTGEPTPIPAMPGDAVTAGATNLSAPLRVEVHAVGAETRVGTLLAHVEAALAEKTPLAESVDRWSRVFVAVVLTLSVITGAVWSWIEPGTALEHVVALLVVSCPCALALATPLTLAVSLSRAARRGIYLKSADVLERLDRVTTVLLDKTGTLTRGELAVTEYSGSERARSIALSLEAGSSHPIAAALRRSFGARALLAVEHVDETPGRGLRGRIDDREVLVGSLAHVEAHGVVIDDDTRARAAAWASRGASPLFITEAGVVIGLAALGDPVRPDAHDVITTLRARGLSVGIVSGDHPAVVAHVARVLGLDAQDVEGGLTPEDKRARVAERARRGERVLMMGDGVNDAAALASAEVGVAVHGGSGAAALASDVVLTCDGVAPLGVLFDGATSTRRTITNSLRFSLTYNAVATSLAMAGLVGPLVAAILMPASSLVVISAAVLSKGFGATRPRTAARAERATVELAREAA